MKDENWLKAQVVCAPSSNTNAWHGNDCHMGVSVSGSVPGNPRPRVGSVPRNPGWVPFSGARNRSWFRSREPETRSRCHFPGNPELGVGFVLGNLEWVSFSGTWNPGCVPFLGIRNPVVGCVLREPRNPWVLLRESRTRGEFYSWEF